MPCVVNEYSYAKRLMGLKPCDASFAVLKDK